MDFQQAYSQYSKIGAAHALGETLRAMYAQLIVNIHGGDGQKYFDYLTGTDKEVTDKAKALLEDRAAAWDILFS